MGKRMHESQVLLHRQSGFTLLELMVAMVIFALLSVAGWQVMDSLSKSRERAKIQVERLSTLQYAYMQLSQDFAQVTSYVVATDQGAGEALNPTFALSGQQVRFVRFANLDPRYKTPPILTAVGYQVIDGQLVRQQSYQLAKLDAAPTTSVLLNHIKDANWTALTPERAATFPDLQTLQQPVSQPIASGIASSTMPSLEPYQQLPKGVEFAFSYDGESYVWRFALPNQAPIAPQNMSQQNIPQPQATAFVPTASQAPANQLIVREGRTDGL